MEIFSPIGRVLRVPPWASNFIGIGFLLLAAASYLISYFQNDPINIVSLAILIIIFSLIIWVLSELHPVLRALLGYMVTLIFAVWMALVFAQIISQNYFTPAIATAKCLLEPLDVRCSNLMASASVDPRLVNVTVAGVTAKTNVSRKDGPGIDSYAMRKGSRIYIQFAGLPRKTIKNVAEKLSKIGWSVVSANQGGEQLNAASGLNQVRYFSEADRNAAVLLARDVSQSFGGNKPISVADFSSYKFSSQVPRGQLEVWVSNSSS